MTKHNARLWFSDKCPSWLKELVTDALGDEPVEIISADEAEAMLERAVIASKDIKPDRLN